MVQAMGKSQTLTADERGSGVLPANSFRFLIGVVTTYLTQEQGSRMMGVRDENAPIVACGLEEFSIFAASPNRTGGMDGYFLHLCR